jgi:hypothetical protein
MIKVAINTKIKTRMKMKIKIKVKCRHEYHLYYLAGERVRWPSVMLLLGHMDCCMLSMAQGVPGRKRKGKRRVQVVERETGGERKLGVGE